MKTTAQLFEQIYLQGDDTVVIIYRNHQYSFFTNKQLAVNRYWKSHLVHDRVKLYGYSLKEALETLYKEFLKKKELGEVEDLGKNEKMF